MHFLLVILIYFSCIVFFAKSTIQVQFYLTTADQQYLLTKMPDLQFNNTQTLNLTVQVNQNIKYQTMEGFGAALTDTSAWLFATQLSNESRSYYLQQLFDPVNGLGISALRIPVAASDFALYKYTYDDMTNNVPDLNLTNFTIEHDLEYIIPVINQIKAINPDIWLLSSPWSMPAWMKNHLTVDNGTVLLAYYPQYAEYYIKFLQGYKQNGIEFDALTVQNEPVNNPCNYPCTFQDPHDQATFIADYLYPLMQQNDFQKVKILVWDHNWDIIWYPLIVLQNEQALSIVEGVAWHCYEGNEISQTLVRNYYPKLSAYMTECSGYLTNSTWGQNLGWFTKHLIIGSSRNWGRSTIYWNLALDQNHGPNDGGCQNCRGVITIPNKSINNSFNNDINNDGPDGVIYTEDYYSLGHASKFVKKGALRINTNVPGNIIDNVAFINKDGSYVLIMLNSDTKANSVAVNWNNQSFAVNLPSGAVATFIWKSNQQHQI